MGKVGWFLVVLAICFVMAGCFNAAARTKERLEEKLAAWSAAHPGQSPTAEDVKLMEGEAAKEVKAERDAELAQAKTDAVNAGIKIGTGDYVGGGILAVGALLTWLGLRKKPAPVKEGGVA